MNSTWSFINGQKLPNDPLQEAPLVEGSEAKRSPTDQFQLFRFPPNQHDKALQAWDSADELAISTILEQYTPKSILILDDLFGALSVGFRDFNVTCVTDSYISQQAIRYNCEVNGLVTPPIISALEPQPKAELVVVKLTKNLGYLEHQLRSIVNAQSSCSIVALGKTTLVTSAVIKLFEQYLSNVSTSLAKKKSRLIFAELKSGAEQEQEQEKVKRKEKEPHSALMSEVKSKQPDLTLHSYANVFSKDKLDIGGRFLADHLLPIDQPNEKFTVIDLGCGNGLLGICWLKINQGHLHQDSLCVFSDESLMAVESAKMNVGLNITDMASYCEFRADDCLAKQQDESVDLILCNPPFHQQNTITTHIAEQMISEAKRCLKKQGELLLVANRHLPYQQMLKTQFGGFKVVATNNKFVIFRCIK